MTDLIIGSAGTLFSWWLLWHVARWLVRLLMGSRRAARGPRRGPVTLRATDIAAIARDARETVRRDPRKDWTKSGAYVAAPEYLNRRTP